MKNKKSFLWTAAIAYIITLLILPLNLRNNNEKILLEKIQENMDAIYLNKVESNIIFEIYSIIIDSSKIRIINSSKLDINDLIIFIIKKLNYFKENMENYYKNKGVNLIISFSNLSIFEYSQSFSYNPILLNSKKLLKINDIEGTLNIMLKVSIFISKRSVFLNKELNLNVLCPCRIFLLKRIASNAIKLVNGEIFLLNKYNFSNSSEVIKKYENIIANVEGMLKDIYESRKIKIDLASKSEIKYFEDTYEIKLILCVNVQDECEAAGMLLNGKHLYPLIKEEQIWLILLNGTNIEIH